MARSILLAWVWRLLDGWHVHLHEIMDRRNLAFWTAEDNNTGVVEPFVSADTTVTYYDDR